MGRALIAADLGEVEFYGGAAGEGNAHGKELQAVGIYNVFNLFWLGGRRVHGGKDHDILSVLAPDGAGHGIGWGNPSEDASQGNQSAG